MDAISLLKQDHRAVEGLFEQFEKTGERAAKARRDLVAKISLELVRHMAVEEQLFYPLMRERLGDKAKEQVLEALEEHHLVKVVLKDLEQLAPESERYEAKVTVLKEVFDHHVHEEEQTLFPMSEKAIAREDLEELGEQLPARKKSVSSRPDPNAPDEPRARRGAAASERGRITAPAAAARMGRSRAKSAAKKPAAKKPAKKSSTRGPRK